MTTAVVSLPKESYSFKQWRVKNPAIMTPTKGFRKQLQLLDKKLEILWDWGSEKWEIWRFPKNRAGHHVLTVQTKDKTYRELGVDVLLKLQEIDSHRLTTKQLIAYFDGLDDQRQKEKARELSNKIQAMAREVWDFHWRPWKGGGPIGWRPIRIQVPKEFKVRRIIEDAR